MPTTTNYITYKHQQPAKRRKLMEHKHTNKNGNITDYFQFTSPRIAHNKNDEVESNFDIDTGFCTYTPNVHQGLLQKFQDVLDKLHTLRIDIATITETGMNEKNYRDHAFCLAAARKGYRVISGPYTDNKASHLLL